MAVELTLAKSELILGGQKSGKSRRAELLARAWLAQSPAQQALLIATAQPWDEEMRQRIARHQRERAERVPGLRTVEEPLHLAEAIAAHSRPDTLLVIDCLTLWLTNWLMPASPHPNPLPEGEGMREVHLPEGEGTKRGDSPEGVRAGQATLPGDEGASSSLSLWERAGVRAAPQAQLLQAIERAPGPLVLVGNEIGLGVIPLGAEVRAFVDALGHLNQDVAQVCQRVTLMAAGLPLTLKEGA
jgi:adenosylcobinamide kinase/adenosylcobinamide-phosphate guanylyltransferase